jgi:hypothetical protein
MPIVVNDVVFCVRLEGLAHFEKLVVHLIHMKFLKIAELLITFS